MQKETDQYFATELHAGRVKYATERESARLQALSQDDVFHAISDAMGTLFAVCAYFKVLGMKETSIAILKGALKFTRTGSSE